MFAVLDRYSDYTRTGGNMKITTTAALGAIALTTLAPESAAAQDAGSLSDLVGARAGQAEMSVTQRGFYLYHWQRRKA